MKKLFTFTDWEQFESDQIDQVKTRSGKKVIILKAGEKGFVFALESNEGKVGWGIARATPQGKYIHLNTGVPSTSNSSLDLVYEVPDIYIPWEIHEIPLGLHVQHKQVPEFKGIITAVVGEAGIIHIGGNNQVTPLSLYQCYEQLNGTPCGKLKV